MAALPLDRLDLRPGHLAMVRALLEEYLPKAEVLAFGSRVQGTGHEASDLDLVVRRPDAVLEVTTNLAALREALIESNVPIRVDLLDWADIPPAFHREIERAYVVLQAAPA
jgi:predicted nucleotidyltransferase